MVDLLKGIDKVPILAKYKPGGGGTSHYVRVVDRNSNSKVEDHVEASARHYEEHMRAEVEERNWTSRFHDCLYCPLRSLPLQDGVTVLHPTRQLIVVYNNQV